MDEVKTLYDYSEKDLVLDFYKLRETKNLKGGSRYGSKIVNFFTALERHKTIGKKGINFYQFLERRMELAKEKYIQNILKYYNTNETDADLKIWKYIFNLYFNSITIFRPVIAVNIYKQFSPQTILDPTMGWGGRIVGACALNIPKYIGIDSNRDLIKPYEDLSKFLSKHSTTEIELFWGDCLTFDYSKIKYDMVFTSPPYFNIEQYNYQERRTKEEWRENFYKPFARKTFQYLEKGGHYCLNVSQEIYLLIKEILGEADILIPLSKSHRPGPTEYKEYIYIWIKKE
jgi:hypothetical protein